MIDSILGWGASVGSWTRVEGVSVRGAPLPAHAPVSGSARALRPMLASHAGDRAATPYARSGRPALSLQVLGEDVHLGPEIFVNGALVLPHKSIDKSVATPQIIM